MKIDPKDWEHHLKALVGYHIDGRLMLFQGLYTHGMMAGAINICEAAIGYTEAKRLETEWIAEWTAKGKTPPKYKDVGTASAETQSREHLCFYCDVDGCRKKAKDARGT